MTKFDEWTGHGRILGSASGARGQAGMSVPPLGADAALGGVVDDAQVINEQGGEGR